MTSDNDPYIEALINDARREAFDDGYVQGVTVSREIIENRIVPLIESLEAVVIEQRHAFESVERVRCALRNALGLVGELPRGEHRNQDRAVRPPKF